MLDRIDAGFSLWDRFKKHRTKSGGKYSVAGRFIKLFEGHNVHKNQIPRFFGRGLTLEDVSTEKDLMPKLNQSC